LLSQMVQPSSVAVSALFRFSTHDRRLYFTNPLLLRFTNGLINLTLFSTTI
jgi:hypothetical protein